MALLKYFSVTNSLPDPNGPLLHTVKPQAIESANKKVSALLASDSSAKDDNVQDSSNPPRNKSAECLLGPVTVQRIRPLCYRNSVHSLDIFRRTSPTVSPSFFIAAA